MAILQRSPTRDEAPATPRVPEVTQTASPIQRSLRGMSFAEGDALLAPEPIQQRATDGARATSGEAVQAAAARGVGGGGGALPHASAIQRSFGRHDVSNVQAHQGGAASEACADMGAAAFATGNHIAFAGAPDLHTAAHEAAHTVQQKGGVALAGGVGKAGDRYEQHADAVADRVVQGKSAEDLLDGMAGDSGGAAGAAIGPVQRVDAAYDFTDAKVKHLKPNTVVKLTIGSTSVVAKQPDGGDRFFNELARASGLKAPETRTIRPDEVEALQGLDVPANSKWVVMDFVEGQTLGEVGVGGDGGDGGFGFDMPVDRKELTRPQLHDLGKSIAFQLLMKGWDRWPLPVGEAKGQHNVDNIMLDDEGEVTLVDNTGPSHALGYAEAWQEQIDGYVDDVLGQQDGGEIMAMAQKFLGQAFFSVGDKERAHLRDGFCEFLVSLKSVDLSTVPTDNVKEEELLLFCEQMRVYLIGKVDQIRSPRDNGMRTKLDVSLKTGGKKKSGGKTTKPTKTKMKAPAKDKKKSKGKSPGKKKKSWKFWKKNKNKDDHPKPSSSTMHDSDDDDFGTDDGYDIMGGGPSNDDFFREEKKTSKKK